MSRDTLYNTNNRSNQMNTVRLIQVRNLFPGQRNYQRQWVRSIKFLGDKWLLARHIND
jgi:hypothetical protein